LSALPRLLWTSADFGLISSARKEAAMDASIFPAACRAAPRFVHTPALSGANLTVSCSNVRFERNRLSECSDGAGKVLALVVQGGSESPQRREMRFNSKGLFCIGQRASEVIATQFE
jgi:hypothetical protein